MTRLTTLALIIGVSACSSDDGPTDITANSNNNGNSNSAVNDGNMGRTPPAPYDDVAFDCVDVIMPDNPERPYGQQGRLLRNNAGDLFYAMLRPIGVQPVCGAAISGAISDTPVFDFLVFVKTAGSDTWELERVDFEPTGDPGVLTDRFGIGAAINPANGQPTFSVAAGDGGLFTCGSSDLVLATRTGPNAYTLNTRATNGADFGGGAGSCPDDPRPEGELECCKDVEGCTAGDDVGMWSDVAFSTDNNQAVVYSDFHNATTEDGGENQDVELWEPRGISGVRPFAGLGLYAGLTFNADNDLVVAFTGYIGGGVYVLRRLDDGPEWLGANSATTGDERGNLFPGFVVGERISLATAPDGTVGLAFHALRDEDDFEIQDLIYCESDDGGATFQRPCTTVDQPLLRVGNFPSLAYNSQSQPAISYYYCGPDTACSRDGLRYAWRDGDGVWWYFNVQNTDNNRSGEFSGLVFDENDAPIIAFTDLTRGAAMVATGTFGTGAAGTCAQ